MTSTYAFCPDCGLPTEQGASFCGGCGRSTTKSQPATAPSPLGPNEASGEVAAPSTDSPLRRGLRITRWWADQSASFEEPPGTKWKIFRIVLPAAIVCWGIVLLGRGHWLTPYSRNSTYAGNLRYAVFMGVMNFTLVFLLALILYRMAIGVTSKSEPSGSTLTRLLLGLGGLAVLVTLLVGLYGASYYRYGRFGDFADGGPARAVPKQYDAAGEQCRTTDYPLTEQIYGVTEWSERHPTHKYECWTPKPLSREQAWYASASFAFPAGSSYQPLSDPAKVLVATQIAADLIVLVMMAGILVSVVRA